MKRLYIAAIVIFISLSGFIFFNPPKGIQGGRKIMNIDKGWKFHEGRLTGAELPQFNDSGWETVDVPHDWRIHDKYDKSNPRNNGYLPMGMGWYRKDLDIKAAYEGSRIYVDFDGVFRNATVWVNGKKAGSHLSGYTGFVLDITGLVDFRSGRNVMAVKVDDMDSSELVAPHPWSEYGAGHEGWWYEGYGIYRHVHLIVTNPLHVSTWGVFAWTEDVSEKSALVKIETSVTNNTHNAGDLTVNTFIVDPQGKRVNTVSGKCNVGGNSEARVQQEMTVMNPALWSPDRPNLYSIVTEILSKGVLIDRYETPLGIRWFKFTPDSGFFLNGKHLQLRGMNLHAGYGGLGTALPDRANYKDVEIAKEMGCNIIRSAHNDPSPSLMKACDELGMLLWVETRYLGADSFALSSLDDMIHRDRNHPSIICWSLANNSGRNDPRLTRMLRVMNSHAKADDPTRPTVFGCEANGDPNKTGFACVTDVMGYNGGGMGRDDRDHVNYPDRKMLISEYSSGRGARGNYSEESVGEGRNDTLGDGRIIRRTSHLTSIYDLCLSHEEEWGHIAKRPFLAGGIMWSGIEYLGEPSGWPVVTSQFGVLDVCRFPKDAYYYYLQEWTHKPMVHIFPHWNWNKRDSVIKVWCYSNCDAVELFLNGKSLGRKVKVPLGHMEWKVPFEPGVLSAKGYNDTHLVAETEVKTAGAPYRLSAIADRDLIRADGDDLSFVTVTVCDKNGTMVPTANDLIKVQVTGGKLLGICSGSPMSHDDPAAGKMKSFNGMLLAIIQSYDHAGNITVRVNSKGLKQGAVVIKAK